MKKAILMMTLALAISFSGCVLQGTDGQYSNDIITVEDYYVSDKNPYPNSPVVIEFMVKNNGEENVPRVGVGFPNYPGFNPSSFRLDCEGTDAVDKDMDADHVKETCSFDKNGVYGEIESQDSRRVLLNLNTIDSNPITPKTYTIYYYVEYDYSGFRKFDIPVIDSNYLEKPINSYSQSSATYGPILLEFELPARGEKVVGGQTVSEYWGVKGVPFRVNFKFTHVGSSYMGSIKDTTINAGRLVLDLKDSLEIAKDADGNYLRCDFLEENGYLYSKASLDVPGELTCTFVAKDFSDPETTANIWATFSYQYRYERSEQFEVQPK